MVVNKKIYRAFAGVVLGLSLSLGACSSDQEEMDEDLQSEQQQQSGDEEFATQQDDDMGLDATELGGGEEFGAVDEQAGEALEGSEPGFGGALDGISQMAEAAQEVEEAQAAPMQEDHFFYTVRKGDYLSVICAAVYGIPTMYKQIAATNGIPNADLIFPGQQFKMPITNQASQAYAASYNGTASMIPAGSNTIGAAAQQATGNLVTYTVKPGDTLGTIAQTHFGTSAAWKTIYQANQASIPNPNLIEVGQQLTFSAGMAH